MIPQFYGSRRPTLNTVAIRHHADRSPGILGATDRVTGSYWTSLGLVALGADAIGFFPLGDSDWERMLAVNRKNHVAVEHVGDALHSVALAAVVAMVAGGCAAAWFVFRRSRSRREESVALTRWEDEGGAPALYPVADEPYRDQGRAGPAAEAHARLALRACRLMCG
jgi:hypothetical protein